MKTHTTHETFYYETYDREGFEGEPPQAVEHEWKLEYHFTPTLPAITSGPPEVCRPAEGGVEPIALYKDDEEIPFGDAEDILEILIEQAHLEENEDDDGY